LWVRLLNMKRIVISLVATFLGLIIGYTGYTLRANQLKLRLELHHTQQQKQELDIKAKELDTKLQEKLLETDNLKKQNDDLQVQLQAKKQQQAVLASVKRVEAPKTVFSGDCASWVAQAGIADTANAYELIRRESHCNPYALGSMTNLGRACGVAQELPCGKSGCQLGDGACQVKWMNKYVIGRYGSWAAAVAWHNANNWY